MSELELTASKRIIKQGKFTDLISPASPKQNSTIFKRPLVEAEEQARQIIAQARNAAAAFLSQAQQQAELWQEQSYAAGRERAAREYAGLLLEAAQKRDKALLETEAELLRLAVKLAEKIVKKELNTDAETISGIVSEAVKELRHGNRIVVRLCPADWSAIKKRQAQSTTTNAADSGYDLVADSQVSAGGCVIESEVGTVDAQLETQLRLLESGLFDLFEALPSAPKTALQSFD